MRKIIINLNQTTRERSFLDEDFERLKKLGELLWHETDNYDDPSLRNDLRSADAMLMGRGSWILKEDFWEPRESPMLIAHAGGAMHGVASKSLLQKGVRVSSATAAIAVSVAELAVGMIILALRQSFARSTAYANGESYGSLRSQGWRGWECHDLTTRTVGLIGLSQVGKRMPPLLKPFGCRMVAYDPYWDAAKARALGVDLIENLDALLVQSDVVSLHTPVTEETEGLIDARRVRLLRKGAVFVNTARSACTDQDALFGRAFRDEIQVYTDVTTPEPLPPNHDVWQCPNIFITPHVAGPTEETRRREGLFAVEEIERYLTGQLLLGEVTLDRYDIVA